ncbi:MAG: quinohemoprotein amine dehydrogenase subunit alpha [Candidatus Sericytochromatia bacterium]|nr:quinohemoprotein amine dehydrogenase subunit alpha [Candidatus Tanganyikabacteria bacterium]
MRKLASIPAIVSLLLLCAGPAVAKPSLFGPDSVVQTTCIACHAQEAGGRVTRIESMRTTPEEWEYTLTRMERRYGMALDPATRKQALKELSAKLGLTQAEAAKVAYLLRSPAASGRERLPVDERYQRVCASCHSWGKVMSHRRTPESWRSLKDFHLASFPSATILSFEEIKWREEAADLLDGLARLLPLEATSWQQERAAKTPDLSGAYLAAGRQPGRGDYQAAVTLEARGGNDYEITRAVRWEDGKTETHKGAGALYGAHSLRMRFNWPGSHVKAAAQLQPDGRLEGTWTVKHHEHVYGDETLYPRKGATRIARVAPTWLTPGGIHKVRVLATGKPGKLDFGPGTRVTASRPLGDDWTEVTVQVESGARPNRRPLKLDGKPTQVEVAVARQIDYITVSPEHGMARIGYEWDPAKPKLVPRQGATFEAWGWSHGPDGKRQTADDVALTRLDGVRWSLSEFHTTFDDDDLAYIGTLGQNGLFMPNGFGPTPQSPSKNPTGNAWVVARWRPNQAAAEDLVARAYLWVTFPDLVKEIN